MPTHLAPLLLTPHALHTRQFAAPLTPLFSSDSLRLVGAQVINLEDSLLNEYRAVLADRKDAAGVRANAYLASLAEESENRRALLLLFSGAQAAVDIAALLPASLDERVAIAPLSAVEAEKTLALFSSHLKDQSPVHTTEQPGREQSLILLKPDNWRNPSPQAAFILQMLASSDVDLIAAKVIHMSVNQALEFYAEVKGALKKRLSPCFGAEARTLLEDAFSLSLSTEIETLLTESVGVAASEGEFYRIIAYMSGSRPSDLPQEAWDNLGSAQTLALLYEGVDAVTKLRAIIGKTNPEKADVGTVRRTFGIDVLENTIHGSDSPESAQREAAIVGMEESTIATLLATR